MTYVPAGTASWHSTRCVHALHFFNVSIFSSPRAQQEQQHEQLTQLDQQEQQQHPRARVAREQQQQQRRRARVARVQQEHEGDHYNAFHCVPGQGKCCGTAGAVAGAAGALGAVLLRLHGKCFAPT